MKITLLTLCLGVVFFGLLSLHADDSSSPLDNDKAAYATTEVRGLFQFCVEATAQHRDADKVDRILEVIESAQDVGPHSKTYGNFRWRASEPAVGDPNTVEFAMQSGILLWSLYRDDLSEASRDRLQRMITLAVEGIKRHEVKPFYTNMYLMKIWNETAIGQAMNLPDLVSDSNHRMDLWLQEVENNGIHEYVSPTYYGTDLDSLGLLARYAKDPEMQRKAQVAIRLFWVDIAANWFDPCCRLSGSHARDYDYLHSRGYLDCQLLGAGFITAEETTRKLPPVLSKLWQAPMPDDIPTLFSSEVPRMIVRRWGPDPWQGTVNYIGHHFSVGSGGAGLDPEDMTLVLNLAGTPKTPVSSFMMDGRGDPYGVNKIAQGSHMKNPHLKPLLATVQSGPEVLYLAVQDNDAKIDQISSNFIFPSTASIWNVEGPITADAGSSLSWQDDRPIFLRLGDVAVGIRFVTALDTSGHPVEISLKTDGGKLRVNRFTCVQSTKGDPTGKAIIALWIRAEENLNDAQFADFRQKFATAAASINHSDQHFSITAAGEKGALSVGVDLVNEVRDIPGGGEPDWGKVIMSVNGRDYFREILSKVTPMPAHNTAPATSSL